MPARLPDSFTVASSHPFGSSPSPPRSPSRRLPWRWPSIAPTASRCSAPARPRRRAPTSAAVTFVEWWGLLLAVLVFGPQMTHRHAILLLPLFTAGLALALFSRPGRYRWIAAVGLTVGVVGVGLPYSPAPDGETFLAQWARWSGPSWSLLLMYLAVVWTTLAHAAALRRP